MGVSYKGVRVIVGVLIAFDYLAVGLRLWARKIKGKPLELNDYLIIVGLVWVRNLTTVKPVLILGSFSQLACASARSLVGCWTFTQ
jgi:hypothetical protein